MSWSQLGSNIIGEASNDYAGSSVSSNSDGTIIAIGARYNDGNNGETGNSGHVRVYEYSSSTWSQKGSDIDINVSNEQLGTSVRLNDDGTILIASSFEGTGGSVRVYEWSGSAWAQKGNTISGSTGDYFCWNKNIDINGDGDVLVIGSQTYNSNKGRVLIYEWDATADSGNGDWVQKGSDINGSTSGDRMGSTARISRDGTTIIAGGYYHSSNSPTVQYDGLVRIYEWSGSAWVQKGSDFVGSNGYDELGRSLDINNDGTIIAMGASQQGYGYTGNVGGYVNLYQWNSSTTSWVQLGDSLESTGATTNKYGWTVSLNSEGNVIAIGTESAGYVNIYQYDIDNDEWDILDSTLTESGNGYGYSLQLDATGSKLVIGAHSDNSNGTTRIYEYSGTINSPFGSSEEEEDSSGNPVPCFTEGTLITTTEGQILIEELKEGDKLISTDGKELIIKYITKYLAISKPNMPIKISKSAFSLNQPSQDLFLSPNHRVPTTEGVKQAKELVNGSTITQRSDINEVYYYNLYVVEKEQNIYANDLEVNVDPVHPHAIQYYRGSEVNPKKINYKFKVNINDVFKSLI